MLTCIIIDDEPLALDIIETYVAGNADLQLVARCNSALEAYQALQTHEPDLLFLDIQMPQLSGIDFLRSLRNPPAVIFTTANPNHALEGYELNAVDYLLKPISRERFELAVQKAVVFVRGHRDDTTPVAYNGSAAPNVEDYIFVKADKKLVRIKYEDILFIEGLKDYVIIKTTTGRVITLQTMKSLEEKLPLSHFRRIHRSYIVSLAKIDAIDGSMVEVAKQEIPIGKNYKDEILELISRKRI